MDIKLSETGDAMFINGPDIRSMVTQKAPEVVAQRLTIRLRTFMGEWFVNTLYGVPYYERILKKQTTKTNVDNIMREQILSEPGVLEIVNFSSNLNSIAREYSCSFTVRTQEGQASITITI